jgi:hypothetical protein
MHCEYYIIIGCVRDQTPMAAARQTRIVPAPAANVRTMARSAWPVGEADGEAAGLLDVVDVAEVTEADADEDVDTTADEVGAEDALVVLLTALLLVLLLFPPGRVTVTAGNVVGETVAEAHWAA